MYNFNGRLLLLFCPLLGLLVEPLDVGPALFIRVGHVLAPLQLTPNTAAGPLPALTDHQHHQRAQGHRQGEHGQQVLGQTTVKPIKYS